MIQLNLTKDDIERAAKLAGELRREALDEMRREANQAIDEAEQFIGHLDRLDNQEAWRRIEQRRLRFTRYRRQSRAMTLRRRRMRTPAWWRRWMPRLWKRQGLRCR